jgi:MFS family permease
MHWLRSWKPSKETMGLSCLIAAQVIGAASIPALISSSLTLMLYRQGLPVAPIMVAYPIAAMLFSISLGWLPDKYKPSRITTLLILVWVGTLTLYAFAHNTSDYLFVRAINGAAASVSTHALAVWIRNQMPSEERSRTRLHAILIALNYGGAGTASLSGVKLNDNPLLWGTVVSAGALTVILVLCGLVLINGIPKGTWGNVIKKLPASVSRVKGLLERDALIITLPNLGVGAAYWTFLTWLPPYIGEQAGEILFVSMIVNGFSILFIMPKLVARDYRLVMGGSICLLIGSFALIWMNESFWLMAGGVLVGIAMAGFSLSISVAVHNEVHPKRLGRGVATQQFIIQLPSIYGPLYAGFMWNLWGPSNMWISIIPLLLIAAILLWYLKLPKIDDKVLIKHIRRSLYLQQEWAAFFAAEGRDTEYCIQEIKIGLFKKMKGTLPAIKPDPENPIRELKATSYGLALLEKAQEVAVAGVDLTPEIRLLQNRQKDLLENVSPMELHDWWWGVLWSPEDGLSEQQKIMKYARGRIPKPKESFHSIFNEFYNQIDRPVMLQYLVAAQVLEIPGLQLEEKINLLEGNYQVTFPSKRERSYEFDVKAPNRDELMECLRQFNRGKGSSTSKNAVLDGLVRIY